MCSMIIKFFLFLLILQISNAERTYNSFTNFFELTKIIESNVLAGKSNNITFVELAQIFEDSCLEPGGLLLNKLRRICIPQEHRRLIQYPPTFNLSDFWTHWKYYTPTNLIIDIYNIQVVEIDVNTLTISIYLEMTWKDPRPVLLARTTFENIYLGMDDEKEIWSPQIEIRSNKMWQNRQGNELKLRKLSYGAKMVKSFDLTTKVKCEMDFQTFPFDKHECNLEVIIEHP